MAHVEVLPTLEHPDASNWGRHDDVLAREPVRPQQALVAGRAKLVPVNEDLALGRDQTLAQEEFLAVILGEAEAEVTLLSTAAWTSVFHWVKLTTSALSMRFWTLRSIQLFWR